MYLNILKKDLKRKKAMNMIVLLFVILATMFVASSVNNIINVTSALDKYFEMAEVPDYLILTMNKMQEVDVEEALDESTAVDSYNAEEIIFLSSEHLKSEDKTVTEKMKNISIGNLFLQSDEGFVENYFLEDGSILREVKNGEIYITSGKTEEMGLKPGDKFCVEIENISREFILAGTIKDAALGSGTSNICKFIISGEDFETYISDDVIETGYGGRIYGIHSSDLAKMQSDLSEASEYFVISMDKAMIEFMYIFDMMITGVLLVISVILILIAFVVLRFTITFTISEEFREIGVMKAIGIRDWKIRCLYLVKYTAISVIGAAVGLLLSFPFGEMLMEVSSMSIIISGQSSAVLHIICAVLIVGSVLLFCYGCTGNVKKMTPIDAIRSGQTGERFRKKSILSLGKSKLSATPFLALNDIVSSPKRYSIITLTFFLCLMLMLILSTTVCTMQGGTLVSAFGLPAYDVSIEMDNDGREYLTEDGAEIVQEDLEKIEQILEENDIPAMCFTQVMFSLPVIHGDTKVNIPVQKGHGCTMDMFGYTDGMTPESSDEIAITKMSAEKLNVDIGDTVTIRTLEGDKEYMITAIAQSMMNFGDGIWLHVDEEISYSQAIGNYSVCVAFTDRPNDDEIACRMEQMKELIPDCKAVNTCAEDVSEMLAVTDTLAAVKLLVTILAIILTMLVTVLMERSFIAKEEGEIALMKAIGIRNSGIYAYHTLRFLFVGILAVMIGELLAMPFTHLCIDPVFKMMGMELAVEYVVNPVEMYLLFPMIIILTTTLSAWLTSLYTRKIKSSDTANIE